MYEGYSEVGIVIRKKDEERYWKKVKAWDKKYGSAEEYTVKTLLFFAKKTIVYSECLKENCIVFHWPKISWCPEYRSINFFKQCFQDRERCDFLRIGEDDPADFEIKMYLGSGILSYYTERHMLIEKDSKRKEKKKKKGSDCFCGAKSREI